MKKILPLLLLTPTIADAECTPAPDCASIGYTQTSCETISLKCPFDQSKLYCFPCDSSYQYPCSEPNEYGDGESCNNKYKSCCNTDCVVGAIYYSDKTCASCLDTTKIPIGVVVKDNELVMSAYRVHTGISWGGDGVNISSLIDYGSATDAYQSDYNGMLNTEIIASSHINLGEDSTTSAAIYCNEYSTEGTNAGDWYLPAAGELYNYVYGNYSILSPVYVEGLSWSSFNYYFWSSTEFGSNLAWVISSYSGIMKYGNSKTALQSVSCFISI